MRPQQLRGVFFQLGISERDNLFCVNEETGNTATGYGLRVAYDQFSGAAALRSAGLGGYGRKNAQKMLILETDGMANTATTANVTNAGGYNSYYNIGPADTFSAGGASASQDAIDVATRICARDNDTAGKALAVP